MLGMAPVDPLKKITELRGGDGNDAVSWGWPDEPTTFKALGVERRAERIVPKNLDQVTALAAEDKEITSVWVT